MMTLAPPHPAPVLPLHVQRCMCIRRHPTPHTSGPEPPHHSSTGRPGVVDRAAILSLPDVLLEIMGNNLVLTDVLALKCACGALRVVLRASVAARVEKQYESVIRHFPLHVVGSIPLFMWFQVEWIMYRPHWMGSTDYLDNVDAREIPDDSVRCCYDEYQRIALLFRRGDDVVVLFQRYSEDCYTWAFASKTLPIGGLRLDSDWLLARLSKRRGSFKHMTNASVDDD